MTFTAISATHLPPAQQADTHSLALVRSYWNEGGPVTVSL